MLGEKPFFETEVHIEVPDKERIQGLSCGTYGITKGGLLIFKRGTFNEPRGLVIYLTRMIGMTALWVFVRIAILRNIVLQEVLLKMLRRNY